MNFKMLLNSATSALTMASALPTLAEPASAQVSYTLYGTGVGSFAFEQAGPVMGGQVLSSQACVPSTTYTAQFTPPGAYLDGVQSTTDRIFADFSSGDASEGAFLSFPTGTFATNGIYTDNGATLFVSGNEKAVSAAPEPSTWAPMLVGVGGIGLALRRPKKRHGFTIAGALAC